MEMKQCTRGGHFYDASIHSECPYCKNTNIGVTIPIDLVRTSSRTQSGDIGKTVSGIKEELGIDPVVGWLVCIEGSEKGCDYRIHTDNNFIGRSEKMDICIRGDDTISRENHAILSFDPRDKIYYFSPGDGRSIVRLGGKAIFSVVEIKAYDIIEIGKTKLIFIPLCGEDFEWT